MKFLTSGGQQQLHIIVRSEATIRRNKENDPNDIDFALRMESYRDRASRMSR
jgi:hypothetical protein